MRRFLQPSLPSVRKVVTLAFAAGLCLTSAGCARNYVVTLSNGRTITTASKPKRVQGMYVYKDGLGQTQYIPEGRVREIAPASMANESKTKFNPTPQR